MIITIIDCGSTKVPDIVKMVEQNGVKTEIVKLSENKKWNGNGIIISGAPVLLTETDPKPYLKLSGQIKHVKVPLLGICFGHQLIGLHFGAEIKKCTADRERQKIHFFRDTRITSGFSEMMEFKEDHCECITLPDNFDLVASSVTCEVEMMKHMEKYIYGVQFHPEVSGDNGMILISKFIQLCKKV